MNNSEINISGIKCDNPKCDYKDDLVKFDQYPEYINKACPKCGENLLTESDYQMCLNLINITRIVDENYKGDDNDEMYKISLNIHNGISIDNIEKLDKYE